MSRLDAIRNEKEKSEKGYGNDRAWYTDSAKLEKAGIGEFKTAEGANFLLFIPPEDPTQYFGLPVFVHFDVGPNKDAFLCLRQHKGQPCPMCERRDQLVAKEAGKEILAAYNCMPPRYLFFVVDATSAETKAKGVMLYDAPKTINDGILGVSTNKRTNDVIDISDPDNPKVLAFDRKGTGPRNTRYGNFGLEDDEPMKDEWLDTPPLTEALKFATYDEIKAAMESIPTASDGATESAPVSDNPRRRRGSSPAPADAGAEEDDLPMGDSTAGKDKPEPPPVETSRRRTRIPREDAGAEPATSADKSPSTPEGDATSQDLVARARERLRNRR